MFFSLSRLRSAAIAGAGALAAILATAPGAAACAAQQTSQPFQAWGDVANYVLVPGGSFEPGAPHWTNWTMKHGAAIVPGNEPFYVHSASDGYSLSLPAGSWAQSPHTCVSLDRPTLRFFAISSGSDPLASLQIKVRFKSTAGVLSTLLIGVLAPLAAWEPSPAYPYAVNTLASLSHDYNIVAFRFVPKGSDNWTIDDVYQDPWRKG